VGDTIEESLEGGWTIRLEEGQETIELREGVKWFGKGVEVSREGIKVRGAHSTKLSMCSAVQDLGLFSLGL